MTNLNQPTNPDPQANPNQPPGGDPKAPNDLVTIHVNGKEVLLPRGLQPVAEVKRLADVPQAYELEQVINGTTEALKQDGKVDVNGCETYVAFPAKGTTS